MADLNDIYQPDSQPDWLTAVSESGAQFGQATGPTDKYVHAFDQQSRAAPIVATPGCFSYTESGNGSSAGGSKFGRGFSSESGE